MLLTSNLVFAYEITVFEFMTCLIFLLIEHKTRWVTIPTNGLFSKRRVLSE